MNTVWKTLGTVGTVVLLLTVGALSAAAASAIPNDSPYTASYVDGQVHTAPVGLSAWYKFDYRTHTRAADRTDAFLTLVNAKNSGVEFDVYTWDQVEDRIPDGLEQWRSEKPVGRGTLSHVSNDLTWVGRFANSWPIYVRVRNTTGTPKDFTLKVEGADVSLSPVAQAVGSQ